jgi:hypothetical protein
MPIFPGPVKHNNPNAPILKLEEKQVKGSAIIDNLSNRNGIDASLRVEGYQAYVQETDKTYVYINSDTSDSEWVQSSNWKIVSGDSFVFDQSSNGSSEWVITHNLNKYPSIMVVDNDGDHIEGYTVVYNTTQKITLTFKSGGSPVNVLGKAYLN